MREGIEVKETITPRATGLFLRPSSDLAKSRPRVFASTHACANGPSRRLPRSLVMTDQDTASGAGPPTKDDPGASLLPIFAER